MPPTSTQPAAFLGPLFEPGVVPIIAAGYYYRDIEVAMHGVSSHRATDFNVPKGTAILAPADGWYVASYGERLLTGDNEQPLFISDKQAEAVNNSSDLSYPSAKQPWTAYFGSYTIQGWHGQGRYTQYGHLDWVDETIPYFARLKKAGCRRPEADDLLFDPIFRAPVKDFRSKAAFLKKGQVLGVSGATGIGWNERTYDKANFNHDGRPDFRGANYTHYDAPHLHFMVFGRRYGKKRSVKDFWDPFGIYGTIKDYPRNISAWPELENSLWAA